MTTTPTAPVAVTTSQPRHRVGHRRVAFALVGGFLALLGLIALAVGGSALWLDRRQDADGFFTAGPGRFATDTHAISAPTLNIHAAGPDALYGQDTLGEIRIRAEATRPGVPLFVGIGPADAVAAYLAGVAHDEVTDVEVDPFAVTYSRHGGGQPVGPPGAQTFWAASDSGTGPRTVTLPVRPGKWTVVIMNGDGAAGVQADVSTGATMPFVRSTSVAAFVVAAVLLLPGGTLIGLAFTGPGRRRRGATGDRRLT